ncbi:hypothetical protein TWF694_005511 [Orbilia ellipsospora]|uniref:Calcineurin-like phosphoesterase domain-containing protein n=1 Tax=Orbilia ellipsospora TaxID=2528407 RepID=A0AAV9WVS3_9PEZI
MLPLPSPHSSILDKKTKRTRFICISDTHNLSPYQPGGFTVPKGDVLIHAGDMTVQGSFEELERTVKWMKRLLDEGVVERVIVVAGNHDITLDPPFLTSHGHNFPSTSTSHFSLSLFTHHPGITLLTHSATHIYLSSPSGPHTHFTIFGSPYTPLHKRPVDKLCAESRWAFQYTPYPSSQAESIWEGIPDKTDILITHGPPWGHLDYSRVELSTAINLPSSFTRNINADINDNHTMNSRHNTHTKLNMNNNDMKSITKDVDASGRGIYDDVDYATGMSISLNGLTQRHSGCESLRRQCWRVRPKLHVFGHIHDGRGVERVMWRDGRYVKGMEEGSACCYLDLENPPSSTIPHNNNNGNDKDGKRGGRGGDNVDIGIRIVGRICGDKHDHGQMEWIDVIGDGVVDVTRGTGMFGGVGLREGETLMVNASIATRGGLGRRVNRPVIVDLDLEVWEE